MIQRFKLFSLGAWRSRFFEAISIFFLSIEVQTHQTFRKIKHQDQLANLSLPDDRIQLTSASFFGDSVRSWTSLKDRFLWCAHCAWTDLVQADVIEFARLKRTRDGIAHGDITVPGGNDVLAVEKLAIRLQRQGLKAQAAHLTPPAPPRANPGAGRAP